MLSRWSINASSVQIRLHVLDIFTTYCKENNSDRYLVAMVYKIANQ